jgi:hypothetical protein
MRAAVRQQLDPTIRSTDTRDFHQALRAKIVGLLVAPATKLAQLSTAPAAKLARVVQAYASKSEAA